MEHKIFECCMLSEKLAGSNLFLLFTFVRNSQCFSSVSTRRTLECSTSCIYEWTSKTSATSATPSSTLSTPSKSKQPGAVRAGWGLIWSDQPMSFHTLTIHFFRRILFLSRVIASFVQQHVGKKWGRFNSDKICSLSYAAIQGRRALVDKFRNSRYATESRMNIRLDFFVCADSSNLLCSYYRNSVMDEEASYRPKIFYTTGPSLGLEEPFPGPTLSKECARGHGPAHGPARRRVSSAPPHNEP